MHHFNPSYSPPTVSWLTEASLPAAAASSFQTLWFPPAKGQATVRASSQSPTIYPVEDVLLQRLTVHHKTSCNRLRVVTSQAERPSVHGGVRVIFLSLSVLGQRAQDWHQSLLRTENWGKHQKLSRGQREYREYVLHLSVRVCLHPLQWTCLWVCITVPSLNN